MATYDDFDGVVVSVTYNDGDVYKHKDPGGRRCGWIKMQYSC